jgi:hypothetical protein
MVSATKQEGWTVGAVMMVVIPFVSQGRGRQIGQLGEKDGVGEEGPGAGIAVRWREYFVDHLGKIR